MSGQPASDDFFAAQLAEVPAIAILRGVQSADAVSAADACWRAGIPLVEVSLSHDPELAVVRAVCAHAEEGGHLAGAGTALTAADVRRAVEAGARFAVAPGLDEEAVRTADSLGLPYLPGVTTPSEVQRAVALDRRVLKLFPAAQLGARWVRALAGPFPGVRLIAVGGVTAANAREFLDEGALGVGVRSALDPGTLDQLVAAVRR